MINSNYYNTSVAQLALINLISIAQFPAILWFRSSRDADGVRSNRRSCSDRTSNCPQPNHPSHPSHPNGAKKHKRGHTALVGRSSYLTKTTTGSEAWTSTCGHGREPHHVGMGPKKRTALSLHKTENRSLSGPSVVAWSPWSRLSSWMI